MESLEPMKDVQWVVSPVITVYRLDKEQDFSWLKVEIVWDVSVFVVRGLRVYELILLIVNV